MEPSAASTTALDLARFQFAFTIAFHIIFPALTIGLASYLVTLEGLWLWKKIPKYRELYHFWAKIFAINFAMGVVSGIVMAYQFGTNWSFFSTFAGGVTGPLLAYEVLTAFFLEAGFLGVMLFGWNRVGPGLHFFATIMVALGTLISTFWILASNSWMQTPTGFTIADGRVVPTDWFQVVFNPSFPYRLLHMVVAAYLSTALFVGGAAAWHMLRGRSTPAIRTMFSMAMGLIVVLAPIQMIIGDLHGLNTLKYQPAKIAAIEGHWDSVPGQSVSLNLFGWPDMAAEKTLYAVAVPYLGSLILTHELYGQVPGLKQFPPDDRPNSTIVFWSFRIMVGLAILMLVLSLWALWLRWKGELFSSKNLLRFAVLMGPAGLIAVLAGWITTEVGRQPWVVYNVMRTAHGVSNHSVAALTTSLAMFVILYIIVFGAGVIYMLKIVARGPDEEGPPEDAIDNPLHRPSRPISAAENDAAVEPAETAGK
ncbi:cytochrome ubiquinol oxidase subunit I [Hyphomicrobium sp.]|uniref:cytochrome ubiquinol oxidase subunit I n=1 Tax=Hyphomicrobium sp. TaxID=82 RepID=UPI002D77287C|nr:cytochrome ubiquinol oxidase subunit I [Hyphomicrobium sp.]HET6387737.1 cytochrome ubiquinol oxidase subunit I [Hyphomicrobium sp.]